MSGTWSASIERLQDELSVLRVENERLRAVIAKADAEVTALADALRAAGVDALLVQAIIDEAKPRGLS